MAREEAEQPDDYETRPTRWWRRRRRPKIRFRLASRGRSVELGSANISLWLEAAGGLVAVKGLGPFLEAFAKKLGDALGESTATALGRLRPGKDRSVVEAILSEKAKVSFELDAATPDEARLALLDLDVTAPELHGKTLRWRPEENAWLAIEAAEPAAEEA